MNEWRWLSGYAYTGRFFGRVLLKAGVLFVLANLVFAVISPLPAIGRLSIYNWLVEGRERLPYGESSAAYNLSLNSLEAMFSSHRISQPKRADEYRVVVIGDSSVWGVLLHNTETLTGKLNSLGLKVGDKTVTAYNLGHPIMSVTKDLMLMEYALDYQPDLIVWMVTLESLPYPKQLEAPIVQNNAVRVRSLINKYNLKLDSQDKRFVEPRFMDRILVGERRTLADWWRLQLYGINWAATGIDQVYEDYKPRSNDFDTDETWHDFTPEISLHDTDIALDVLAAGKQMAGTIPLVLINEPIYVADGRNSNVRYNFWYPKWAYDKYRDLLLAQSQKNNWHYVDLWDVIAPVDFTDSPVHLTPYGSQQLSQLVGKAITAVTTPSDQ